MDLFASANESVLKRTAPLAVRMRPKTLQDIVGQEENIGPNGFLRKMIATDNIPSMILFGPPGTGKTTIAQIIANMTGCHFENLNAVASGIADVRKVVEAAKDRLRMYGRRTILFIDEIHRFNKNQQDSLLPYVEDGRIILIGATTENPYFEVNSPLLSRARVVRLNAIDRAAMLQILQRALQDKDQGLGDMNLEWDTAALDSIIGLAHGDARIALNILEQAALLLQTEGNKKISVEILRKVAGEKMQFYDKSGDNHYDIVSAFIKSMRGSDPDAAVHYLARMLAAGEDVNFISRRIVICAAEDVGNADPQALIVAMTAAQAAQFVGLPEARIPLAQATTYVASAPKSNAAYSAINHALIDISNKDCGQVPLHLRDTSYKGARKLGHGIDYRYPHDYSGGYIQQEYLPRELAGIVYYHPTERGKEKEIKRYLDQLRDGAEMHK